MKAKIIKCGSSGWWYAGRIGKIGTIEVEDSKPIIHKVCGEDNYYIKLYDGSDTGYISVSEVEILSDEPKLYERDGVRYALPDWVNFVTCDGVGYPVIGWKNKPVDHKSGFNGMRCNFQDPDGGKRTALYEYVAQLPNGAFIEEIK